MPLLERDDLLAELGAVPPGQVVLVAGEAGIGKTSLVRAFCERQDARVLWGACDALFTPRPLGPLADVADVTGGDLRYLIRDGSRPSALLGALVAELRSEPTVLVLEDLHWADEGTLDVLRLLARRLGGVRSRRGDVPRGRGRRRPSAADRPRGDRRPAGAARAALRRRRGGAGRLARDRRRPAARRHRRQPVLRHGGALHARRGSRSRSATSWPGWRWRRRSRRGGALRCTARSWSG